MSGHSKWATTKRRKSAVDARRSDLFTKLGNLISVAARQGGDPAMNFSLRMAIDKARSFNMPKENIERAIKRGLGEGGGAALEEVIYEGFGPGKTAMMIECLTDNRNRTASEIKHLLEKHGGTFAGPGSVAWMFEKKGCLSAFAKATADKLQINNLEELELRLIDFGIEDIEIIDDEVVIYTKPEELQKTKENLEKAGVEVSSASIEYVAKEKKEISEEAAAGLEALINELDEHNDVKEYYLNIK